MNARLNERPSCALLKSMLTGFMLACMSATLAGCRNIKPNISGSATPVHESPQGYAWGAVAHGGGVLGFSTGMRNDLEAESEAIKDCESKRGRGCSILSSYYNMCITAIMSGESVYWADWYDEEGSKKRALSECQYDNNRECIVSYSNCTKPFPQK